MIHFKRFLWSSATLSATGCFMVYYLKRKTEEIREQIAAEDSARDLY